MGRHQGLYRSGFFQVFVNKQINENMTGMASPASFTGFGHFFYGREIMGFDAGTNGQFTYLKALTDDLINFAGGVFHVKLKGPSGE